MRLILTILFSVFVFCSDAQIIRANAYYTPLSQPLLLDVYTGAAAAYSLRKLRTTYTGAAIRVRRSSDNTEQDIGFVGVDLDTVSLKNFVGANNGFVTTWYDQSTSKNVAQSAAANQPRIVNAGVVDRLNGKPAIMFDGSNDFLEAATASDWVFLHFGTVHTNFGVTRAGNVTDPEAIYIIWGTTSTVTRRGAYLGHDTRSSQPRDRVLVHVIGNADLVNNITCLNIQPSASTPANTQFLHYLLGKPDNSTLSERSAIATNTGSTSNAVSTAEGKYFASLPPSAYLTQLNK